MRKHMGLPPILDNELWFTVSNQKAPEESHEDGCPGAWYRCDFVFSVQNYERLYHHQSGFQTNEMLNRTDDALVLQATAYLENQILLAIAADQARELANK